MDTPKVGEIWVSISGISSINGVDHKIIFVSPKYIVTKSVGSDSEWVFKNGNYLDFYPGLSADIKLSHKKKNKITRWVGFFYKSNSLTKDLCWWVYDKKPDESTHEPFLCLQKIEIEVD